jgi:predicted nuclease of predicted toxin-antitoxin system
MNFIFDANLSFRLAEGLAILESGNDAEREVIANCKHADNVEDLGIGATDPQVIQYAGKNSAIIISQDDDFKRIEGNRLLIKELKVGYVLYKPPKRGCRYWDIVESFVSGWKTLKESLKDKEPPFMFIIDKKGSLQEIKMFN